MHWQQATEKYTYRELQEFAQDQGILAGGATKTELARAINFAQVERDQQ